ncbi:hypothetical protein C8F01DRAFT_1168780 [Mycena amicta]|nr:hypothetical protein C8F01DRAFT_1168780 [Mycena amicta]
MASEANAADFAAFEEFRRWRALQSEPTPTLSAPAGPPIVPYIAQASSSRPLPTVPTLPWSTGHPRPPSSSGHPLPTGNSRLPPGLGAIPGASSLDISMTSNHNQTRQRAPAALTQGEISIANQGRQTAIHNHFPPQPTLPIRNGRSTTAARRTRGPAVRPPAAAPAAEADPVEAVFTHVTAGNRRVRMVGLDVQVRLPANQHILFNAQRQGLERYLEGNCLRFQYRLPDTTTVTQLMRTVKQDMEQSNQRWSFVAAPQFRDESYIPGDGFNFRLLRLSNGGRPTHGGIVNMLPMMFLPDFTIAKFFDRGNAERLVVPHAHINGDRLIVHLAVYRHGITGYKSISNEAAQVHACLPSRMNTFFCASTENGHAPAALAACACAESASDAETVLFEEDEDEDENMDPAAGEPDMFDEAMEPQENENTVETAPRRSSRIIAATAPVPAAVGDRFHTTMGRDGFSILTPLEFGPPNPTRLWAAYDPPTGRSMYRDAEWSAQRIFAFSCPGARADFIPPSAPVLDIGGTEGQLAPNLMAELRRAAELDDFSKILSPNRTFHQVSATNPAVNVSIGPGLEEQTITDAIHLFTREETRWFAPLLHGCGIQPLIQREQGSELCVSRERCIRFKSLGALFGLAMIHGRIPENASPYVLQYVFNNCNLASISRDSVREWDPEFLRELEDLANGTGDMASHRNLLTGQLGIQPSTLAECTAEERHSIAVDVLQRALIGPFTGNHFEIKAFWSGLRLPCANGFALDWFINSRNSESVISHLSASLIHDFTSLSPHLTPRIPANIPRLLGLPADHPIANFDIRNVFTVFLAGAGVPCPSLFNPANIHTDPVVDIANVDHARFRSRALCLAATGRTQVPTEGGITLAFVGPEDGAYGSDAGSRAAHMSIGRLSFATCFMTVRIPLVYLATLCTNSYPTRNDSGDEIEPRTLESAIDHWLFTEIVECIGSFTRI